MSGLNPLSLGCNERGAEEVPRWLPLEQQRINDAEGVRKENILSNLIYHLRSSVERTMMITPATISSPWWSCQVPCPVDEDYSNFPLLSGTTKPTAHSSR